jgi:hypothetical protein
MWFLADVVGLFSINVGSFSRNLGWSVRIFSANVGQKRRMLSGPAIYVLGPLQITPPLRSTLITSASTLLRMAPPLTFASVFFLMVCAICHFP